MELLQIAICEDDHEDKEQLIKNLENRLQPLGFETSCRGILVNMENIARIKNYKIFFKNGECVALSQKRAVEFKKNLNAYIHKGE